MSIEGAAVITRDQLREARSALARPPHLAEGLPGLFYGPSFFELEQKALFPQSWCAVAVASAIPKPGDVLPLDFVGWPIILVRGRDRQIRAFHNICRHRAMRPVAEPCNVNLIRCPWHSWAYDLQGALVATPEIGGAEVHTLDSFERAGLGLKPIPVGQWLDYVFVNLDGAAAPFAEHIKPASDLLAHLDLDNLRYGGRLQDVYLGNWKLFTEGFVEDYHLPFGHPQLGADTFRNTAPCFADNVYTGGWMDFGGGGDDSAPAAQPSSDIAELPPIRLKDGTPSTKMLVLNLFPTAMALLGPNELMLGILSPDGPTRTKVELNCYYDGEAATSDELGPAREQNFDMWRTIVAQDFPFVVGTQATIEARDAAGIRPRFSPYWEQPVINFQRMVLDALGNKGGMFDIR